eukprot:CAMPEP_0194166834 /NCGR_PEP_ID=MMETSP0154-20130528/2337_1 /TAXON_ID=1049557 /ORGANISM="Thalassiothrix antarctica, Strain L6-D1" /LENGTH=237 /DNA_ID=CAMNT_0038877619 /DNA_START=21 /DNA_END=734 /DNA_ORIENTATION=+
MIKALILLCVLGLALSFTTRSVQQRPYLLLQSRVDSSAAVADALKISKEFGAASKEARLAWETVEEMDGADMSASMPSSDSTSLTEKDIRKMDYKVQVSSLNRLLADTQDKMSQIKVLAASLKDLEIEDPDLSNLPEAATGLKTVLQEAKAASEVYGPESAESAAAWNEVDFCTDVMGGVECNVDTSYRYSAASLQAHHLYDAVIDPTFFEEAVDAVEMLENLRRFIRIETKRVVSR